MWFVCCPELRPWNITTTMRHSRCFSTKSSRNSCTGTFHKLKLVQTVRCRLPLTVSDSILYPLEGCEQFVAALNCSHFFGRNERTPLKAHLMCFLHFLHFKNTEMSPVFNLNSGGNTPHDVTATTQHRTTEVHVTHRSVSSWLQTEQRSERTLLLFHSKLCVCACVCVCVRVTYVLQVSRHGLGSEC